MNKPIIFFNGREWVCMNSGVTATGADPRRAYLNWKVVSDLGDSWSEPSLSDRLDMQDDYIELLAYELDMARRRRSKQSIWGRVKGWILRGGE